MDLIGLIPHELFNSMKRREVMITKHKELFSTQKVQPKQINGLLELKIYQ